jgi:hypothetical protein
MSHSTPHRVSGSKQSSSTHFTHTPSSKQDTLKETISSELADATWELDPVTLARALSSKTRKGGVDPLNIDDIDDFENYDIEIDKLDGILGKAANALKGQTLPFDNSEKAHYGHLISFLNACVDACRVVCQKLFYERLKFIVFDTETQDGVLGASPLKPDGAGANGLSEGETKLWWRPESGSRASTLEIPIEVKGLWSKLVSQAGTYARALMTARPLRQFSLVIAYNHAYHELRFLVFHAGGMTASHALCPNKRVDHKNILRLVLALLTWETHGDAGLPEWCNDSEMFVQRDEYDEKGVRMRVTETLYERYGIRGRGPQVSRLSPIDDQSLSVPALAPAPLTTTLRRSNRIAEKAKEDAGHSSQHRGMSFINYAINFSVRYLENSTHRSSQKAKTRTAGGMPQDEIHGAWSFARLSLY